MQGYQETLLDANSSSVHLGQPKTSSSITKYPLGIPVPPVLDFPVGAEGFWMMTTGKVAWFCLKEESDLVKVLALLSS